MMVDLNTPYATRSQMSTAERLKLTAARRVRYAERMLTQTWKTSERKYRVREERDFSISTADGTKLNSYLYRPDADGKFPVILGVVQLLEISPAGAERLLTRGWLRGSQRKIDPDRSKPWAPYHTHERREPLKPNEIYEFNIEIRPYGIRLRPGYRLAIRISGSDGDPPTHHLHGIASGHVARQASSRGTIYHDTDHPSHLLLPITRGNRIGTFISGGRITN
jgi:predicted acyl esterase